MNKQNRRFIFIDFANLKKVKFKKLEKVCDKIFVFISSNEQFISFELVQQMQRLGKDVKWVVIDTPVDESMNYHICFLLGRLHQKVDKDIEFAILSNDKSFDTLINFINDSARSCIRVKRNKTEDTLLNHETEILESRAFGEQFDPDDLEDTPLDVDLLGENDANSPLKDTDELSVVDFTAKDTVERLLRSGNRPVDVAMLKNYIRLNNKGISSRDGVDLIIERLKETQEIEVNKGEVTYHF